MSLTRRAFLATTSSAGLAFAAWRSVQAQGTLPAMNEPAFIIEELDDGRFTVFVPSVPTPLAGAVCILSRERVHPLDVSFTQAIQAVSRWGSGSKVLVAAMKPENTVN